MCGPLLDWSLSWPCTGYLVLSTSSLFLCGTDYFNPFVCTFLKSIATGNNNIIFHPNSVQTSYQSDIGPSAEKTVQTEPHDILTPSPDLPTIPIGCPRRVNVSVPRCRALGKLSSKPKGWQSGCANSAKNADAVIDCPGAK